MRKEVFFAILAGTIFGLVVAFGIWRANSSIKPQETTEISPTEVTPSPAAAEIGLTIAKPEPNSVFIEDSTEVSGLTQAGAWVTISAEEEDYIIQADSKGAFEQTIDLISGVNEIIVTSFVESGKSNTQKFLAVYSTEFK